MGAMKKSFQASTEMMRVKVNTAQEDILHQRQGGTLPVQASGMYLISETISGSSQGLQCPM